jgi:hypothetical protein
MAKWISISMAVAEDEIDVPALGGMDEGPTLAVCLPCVVWQYY